MLKRCAVVAVLLIGMVLIGIGGAGTPARAQEALRQQVNAGSVTIITGGIEYADNTYGRLAGEMALVLDKPGELRVLPMLGRGPIENVRDILYLRGVDIGMMHSDVLTSLKQRDLYPQAQHALRFLAKLYDEYFHVIAHRDVKSVQDLEGKAVVVGRYASSGSAVSAQTLFAILGIKPEILFDEWESALSKAANGEIAAIVYSDFLGSNLVRNIPAGGDLRLLALPHTDELRTTYVPAKFTAEDYPNFVGRDDAVPTLHYATIMAAYNWQPQHDRYGAVARFVTRLFDQADKFRQPPYHPCWKHFDAGADVPGGWTRFAPARAWVDAKIAAAEAERRRREASAAAAAKPDGTPGFQAFATFVRKERGWQGASEEELGELFKLYQDWTRQQR
jgi:TRAP-type uncharacterized transport system substrate-binding protein